MMFTHVALSYHWAMNDTFMCVPNQLEICSLWVCRIPLNLLSYLHNPSWCVVLVSPFVIIEWEKMPRCPMVVFSKVFEMIISSYFWHQGLIRLLQTLWLMLHVWSKNLYVLAGCKWSVFNVIPCGSLRSVPRGHIQYSCLCFLSFMENLFGNPSSICSVHILAIFSSLYGQNNDVLLPNQYLHLS